MLHNFTLDMKKLEEFPGEFRKLLEKQSKLINHISTKNSCTYEEIMGTLQDMDEERELFFAPLSHLNSVNNSKETQKAYEECLPMLSRFNSELAQNDALYSILKKLRSDDLCRQKVLENEIRDFRLAGAELAADKKKRLEAIDIELSELSNTFSQNLLDATNSWEMIIEDEKDVHGIPESDLAAAQFEKNGKSKWRFTLQIPSYTAYMTYGPNRSLREKIYKAYTSRAPENSHIIDRILELRNEKAAMLGFSNYCNYALQSRDADYEEEVLEFLEELLRLTLPQAKAELEELRIFSRDTDGLEDMKSFDTAYYSEKLKKHLYDFDESDTKPYFKCETVLEGMLEIVSELFGVEFKQVNIAVWHDTVKIFDIYRNGQISGRIYFDLHARESKRGGAWMQEWETRFVDTGDRIHLPSVFVVANFAPGTDGNPSLLRHDDVVTLFHEMGHAVHHLFSNIKERSISGINGVSWDVVEFPSQFLENFAYEKSILRRFAKHYKSGENIPDDLLDRIKAAKNFQAATHMIRQLEFALFDFKLHGKLYQGEEVQKLLDKIRERTSILKPPAYNRFQHGFAHIFAGGYAAGYYSYKWAEVLSADAFFECIDENGNFKKDKAEGYRQWILEKGGSEDMSRLYQSWLGRKPRIHSLLRLYEIGRTA